MPSPASLGHHPGDASVARRRRLVAAALIALAALAAYANSFTGPFVFDDGPSIATNRTLRHLWPPWESLQPPPAAGVAGRPVLNFSFALNHAISGSAVWSYHALNLLVHLLGGLALFGVVRRTLLRLRGATPTDPTWLALAIAAAWVVHPVQTASVTYVSQRAESLMALFYLLTLYSFSRATVCHPLDDKRAGRTRRAWAVATVAACALGMATKEVMVGAPLLVLLYDRTFVSMSFRDAWRQHRKQLPQNTFLIFH